jgi:hypothetical protein
MFAELVYTTEPVGAGLARDSGGSVHKDVGCAGIIASKPAPTMSAMFAELVYTTEPVGASLLAIAVVQPMKILAVPTSSRAGSLPQFFAVC